MTSEKAQETTTRERPKPAGFVRRCARLSAALISGAMILAILLAGGVYARLKSGPVDLQTYLPDIQTIVSDQLPDADISIGGARLAIAEGGGARLEMLDVALADVDGTVFAKVPKASGSFRLWDLAQGVFDPDDVTLTGISIRLIRDEADGFRFGFGGLAETDATAGVESFRELLAAATNGEIEAAAGSSEGEARGQVFRLEDASILYTDLRIPRAYRAKGADLRFWRTEGGVFAVADVTLQGGGFGDAVIEISGLRTNDGVVAMTAELGNASPRDIADQIGALDWMAAFDAPVGGSIQLELTAETELSALNGEFTVGEGQIRLSSDATEPITSGRLAYTFEPEASRFLVDQFELASDRASLRGEGFVQVNRDDGGEPEDIVAQLDFQDIEVAAPELLDAPLGYREGRLTGRLTLEPLTIEIGELRLARERMRMAAAGRIWLSDDEWLADMTMQAGDFTLQEMLEHWPRDAAPGALEWMSANMETAHVIDTDAVIRLGGDAEEVKIDFTFDEAMGHYLRPMPPIRNGVGSGQVDLERFSLTLDSGVVTAPDGEEITLDGSTFVIADLNHPDTPGEARILAKGRTQDALALIDSEPLKLTSALDVPLDDVGGTVEVTAVSTFPLLKDLLLEDVQADASAVFADLSLDAPGLDRPVTAETLKMEANTAQFRIEGDVVVSGLPAAVTWTERFSPSQRSIRGRARLTPERLKAFGVTQDWFNDGSIDVSAAISPGGGGASFDVEADLERAGFAIPEIGWSKSVGSAGAVSAKGAIEGAAVTLDAFDFRAPDLSVAGVARTNAKGAPIMARFDRFRFRDAIDLAVRARRQDQQWLLSAIGPKIDFSRLDDLIEKNLEESGGSPRGSPVRLRLEVDEVRLTEDIFFSNVRGRIDRTWRTGLEGTLRGALSGGADMKATFRKSDNDGLVTLNTDNAGRFMRDAGVFDDGSGGALAVRAEIGPGGDLRLKGQARINDLVIHDDAKLEKLLSGAELDDLQTKMREDGIVLEKIRAPFRYEDGVLSLKDATARGPEIGVNISGGYRFDGDRLDFKGVFTPLYALNSAIGKIPLLGDLLTGGDGKGVFAFNFSVNGSSADPQIAVNPLSVLTPGVFRRIFEAGDASQTLDIPRPGAAETGDR